jgi:transcriptional regulator with XRE-family HTH domain
VSHPGWLALGRLVVRERRAQRFRTRREFAAHIGISTRTLDSLETGAREAYSADTIAAVEIALGWEPGSVERVVAGSTPSPVRDPELDRLLRAWRALPVEARRMLAEIAERALGP